MVQHAAKKATAALTPGDGRRRSRACASTMQPPAYELPPLLAAVGPAHGADASTCRDEALEENARMLESVLDDYGVKGEITAVRPGPVVTMYELEPAPGLKASPRDRPGG